MAFTYQFDFLGMRNNTDDSNVCFCAQITNSTGWLISSVTFFLLVKFNSYSYNNSVNHIYNLTRDSVVVFHKKFSDKIPF